MGNLPNLYSLRFFLAIVVVLFHIPITAASMGLPAFNSLPVFSKGLIAVNFFFSLSGFLIIRNLYMTYKRKKTIEIGAFYLRRIRRLWPVYYLVLIVGLLLYHWAIPVLGVAYETSYNWTDLWWHFVFFIPNIFNGDHKVGGILNIFWSVGVEEQFYLVFPLLLWIFRKRTKIVLALILIASLVILFIDAELYYYRNYYFYFAAGGLMGILGEEGKLRFLRFKAVQIGILIVFALTFFSDLFVFDRDIVANHLFLLIVSNLLIPCIACFPLFNLDTFKISYLGKISYGIYMYHMIVVTLFLYLVSYLDVDEWMDDTLLIVTYNGSIILLTLFISHLSYQYFEKRWYAK